MHIVIIDATPALADALREPGHTVTVLALNGGIVHAPGFLAHNALTPDLLIQQEHLGRRSFLGGLEQISCPTIFWAIDTHLNLFWHKYYGLLFDAVLTPHVSLFSSLAEEMQPPVLRRFAQAGEARPWRAHGDRAHSVSFWGRLNANRSIRGWFVDALTRKCGLHFTDTSSYAEMMRLYDDSRILPNECLANEVNYRLLEGASAGCLMVSPDVGPDQDALFTPGEEFLPYRDGLELVDHVQWAQRTPHRAEKMAWAAYRRVQAEHLPRHRARTVLEVAAGLSRQRATGLAASLAFWLTLAKQIRNGIVPLDPTEHARQGLTLLEDARILPPEREFLAADAFLQCVHVLAGSGSAGTAVAMDLCAARLAKARAAKREGAECGEGGALARVGHSLAFNSLASALAVREGRFSEARAFLAHFAADNTAAPLPATPFALCLEWAARLRAQGVLVQTGFPYDPGKGELPECAHEFLLLAQFLEPENAAVHRHMADLLAGIPSHLSLYLEHLAQCSLVRQDDWRVQLEYGLASLRACRVDEGLFEIASARQSAAAHGRERLFAAMLEARSPAGHIQRALANLGGSKTN